MNTESEERLWGVKYWYGRLKTQKNKLVRQTGEPAEIRSTSLQRSFAADDDVDDAETTSDQTGCCRDLSPTETSPPTEQVNDLDTSVVRWR
jgi:hypothetical protein